MRLCYENLFTKKFSCSFNRFGGTKFTMSVLFSSGRRVSQSHKQVINSSLVALLFGSICGQDGGKLRLAVSQKFFLYRSGQWGIRVVTKVGICRFENYNFSTKGFGF